MLLRHRWSHSLRHPVRGSPPLWGQNSARTPLGSRWAKRRRRTSADHAEPPWAPQREKEEGLGSMGVNKPPPMLSCALLAWCQEGVRLRAHTSVALPVAYFSGKHPLTAWNCFHEAPRTPCLRGPNIGPFGSKFRHVWTR